jgi:hypothetical protein
MPTSVSSNTVDTKVSDAQGGADSDRGFPFSHRDLLSVSTGMLAFAKKYVLDSVYYFRDCLSEYKTNL